MGDLCVVHGEHRSMHIKRHCVSLHFEQVFMVCFVFPLDYFAFIKNDCILYR